jgi:hypothetical protein
VALTKTLIFLSKIGIRQNKKSSKTIDIKKYQADNTPRLIRRCMAFSAKKPPLAAQSLFFYFRAVSPFCIESFLCFSPPP